MSSIRTIINLEKKKLVHPSLSPNWQECTHRFRTPHHLQYQTRRDTESIFTPLRGSHLILQWHHWVVFGSVDVKNMVSILCTQVIGDIGKRGACSFGNSVINDDYIFFFIYSRILPRAIHCMPLFNFPDFMSCDCPFCKEKGESN